MKAAIAPLVLLVALSALADDGHPTLHASRITAPISIDGDLSDSGWKEATRVDRWWETNPGDNVEPKVKQTAWIGYDDKFFYAAFDLQDPDPKQIHAPFNDRDHIGGNTDDYAGVILDTRFDHKTAILFLATPRGVQYDSVSDDTTGNEDSSPDFFWDSAAKINDHGWTLEIRIPLTTLRYDSRDPQTWGILLYRNWPRERRYQIFANKLPRGGNCFICNEDPLDGLQGLPPGGHLVAAPYVTEKSIGEPRGGVTGAPLVTRPVASNAGADVKWTPTADTAVDATINPDFSQIESDVAVITTNERFAIFLPEKRPFFLEGFELFSTPMQAVYTRTITSPRWGARSTGKFGDNAYTFLVAQDRGGGDVILPSATSSDFAFQDFQSTDFIGRMRHDIGKSFVSFLITDREESGGAHNRVFGPDFQIRKEHDTLTGQFLVSDTRTPNRPDLAEEWNGRTMRAHAYDLWWQHQTPKFDVFYERKNFGDRFRADSGFIPQVGYTGNYFETGYTIHPTGFFNRVRYSLLGEYDTQNDDGLLYRLVSAAVGADGKYRSFSRVRYAYDKVRNGDTLFPRHQVLFQEQFSVNDFLSQIETDGWIGQQVDFSNNRLGRGASINLSAVLRPTDHLELVLTNGVRWLNVSDTGHVFTAQAERVRATYTFNRNAFLRAIVQNQRTVRNPQLYIDNTVDSRDGSLATQLLFAYKLNWQTVLYAGYGDLRDVDALDGAFVKSSRQFFTKVSYAFQR
jgi:hypothetical protein